MRPDHHAPTEQGSQCSSGKKGDHQSFLDELHEIPNPETMWRRLSLKKSSSRRNGRDGDRGISWSLLSCRPCTDLLKRFHGGSERISTAGRQSEDTTIVPVVRSSLLADDY